MSLVEVVVALSVLVVAASIFCQMLISTARMRQLSRENSLAANAARVVLERMRNETFLRVYQQYNEDPKDDPGGNGTGPGNLFDVPGLDPLGHAPQGKVGRIYLPSTAVEVAAPGGKNLAGAGATTIQWQVREDIEDPSLGLPRDLNGNNVIDSADHSKDYLILPVRVVIEWKRGTGARKFEVVSQLGDFPRIEAP